MIHFTEEDRKIKDFVKNMFLFQNLSNEEFEKLTSVIDFEKIKYSRGETIYSPTAHIPKIGFVFDGECEIICHKSDGKTILNSAKAGDSFGILAALGEKDFKTEIYSKKNTTVLFMDSTELINLIYSSPTVAMNVIKFLSGKVAFLNRKLNTISKSSVEKKLASYLLSRYRAEEKLNLTFNIKKCSESISAGRASVYRALESLKSKGYIQAEDKTVTIIDYKKLEEYTK